MFIQAASVLALLVCQAVADTIRIDVGMDGLSYTPDTIMGKTGDVLEFHFHAGNHSVVMGNFTSPCQPAQSGGWFSGFIVPSGSNSEADDVFQVTLNDPNTIFFYCGQNIGDHCKSGMSGVVNPSKDQSITGYRNVAKNAASAGVPDAVFGGDVVPASQAQATAAPSPTKPSGGGGGGLYGGGGSSGSSNGAGNLHVSASIVAGLALGIAAMLL